MGTQTTFILNTHFKLMNNKALVYDFLYKNMFLFLSSIWVFITTFTLYLLNFLTRRNLFRFHVGDSIEKQEPESSSPVFLLQEVKQIESNCLEPEPEIVEHEEKEYNGFIEEDIEEETATLSSFSFKFQSYEDTRRSNGGFEDYVIPEKAFIMNTNTSKYQFLPGKDFNGFIEEPKVVSFSVQQLYVDLNEESLDKLEFPGNHGFSSEKSNLEIGARAEELVNDTHTVDYSEKPESLVLPQVQLSQKVELISVESSLSSSSKGKAEISDGVQSVHVLEKEFTGFDSEPESESVSFGDKLSVGNHVIESNSQEVEDFEEGIETENMIDFDEVKLKDMEGIHSSEKTLFDNSNDMDRGVTDTSDRSSFVLDQSVGNLSVDMEVKIELMEEIQSILETEFLNESEVSEKKNEQELEHCHGERAETMDYLDKSQDPSLQDSSLSGSEDSNGLEIWEHQDLIEQLKMELKKVRATGLPTILEESESPKVVDDLKPWKIEEKFLHEDRIDELHKFYKIYRERMRKFDILNYQKMYAIGFLQLKDPLQTMSCKKSATTTLASVLSQNLGLCKRKSTEADTSAKFMTELQNDLEMIYVGQLSLSWEFLHWQYQKARELLESDPYETRRYNQVAGEFQQFQVLMQRFMENELFQGPRVQNYIKNRCILRNLLQVPVIKEDSRDKEGRKRSKDAITCSLLLMVIEESMRIFWEFLRADKNAGIVMFKGFLGTQVELQDPADSELLLEVQTTLQKKDRKLKELMRIGNCIVRRFQKNHHQDGGGRPNQVILYCQVDLKLVSRVLNVSRITTDQLVWCRKKLDKITLVDRKIHIEPSFLPFPC